ncbi:MAG: B12-binding domain-containing radical SAM protein [Actinobacteria bacterium]|nr:B12-binding domain-containing radical SAM protein [Actinomycetota bacterium]
MGDSRIAPTGPSNNDALKVVILAGPAKRQKKVLLITPPYHCGVLESAGVWLPLPFVYLAGALRWAGYGPVIYDAMSRFDDYEAIGRRIEEEKPDVVCSTAYTATVTDAIEVLRLAKKINPEVVTVLGGIHPTFCWEEILTEDADAVGFVVRGEGEVTLPELLDAAFGGGDLSKVKGIAYLEGGRPVVTAQRPFIGNLDSLGLAWDLVDWPLYTFRTKDNSVLAVTQSSRGCTQGCTFCSQQLFWERTWRARSPENFIEELEFLRDRFGVDVAMITDEVPTLDRERWERILDLMIERKVGVELLMETRVDDILRDEAIMEKYRRAGVVHIYVGVESASQETLDRWGKNIEVEESRRAIELINGADIISETSFVLGMPEETPESIARAVELAKHYNPDMAFFLAIAPWPYSEIYPEVKEHVATLDYRKYNLVEPVIKPVAMRVEELSDALLRCFRDFYIGKFARLDDLSPFKREYMLKVAKLLAEHSYLKEQMKGMGEMPAEVKALLEKVDSRQ